MKAKIHVILPTAKHLHRQILEGILDYGRQHGPWQFHFETGFSDDQSIGKGRRWGCSGIIAMVRNPAHLSALLNTGLPAVFINPPTVAHAAPPPPRVTYVIRNQQDIGRSAAEYFLERGYRSFAFVNTIKQEPWSRNRRIGYEQRLAQAGFTCSVYDDVPEELSGDFDRESQKLSAWLRTLPPDTALYAVRDRRALQVLGLCQDCGISVPDTVAVLGTDDDEVLCEAVSPTLSSIALDGVNSGKLCAKLLDRNLRGRKHTASIELDHPRIVTRQSTDAMKLSDPFVAKALEIIRSDLTAQHKLDDLSAKVGISKRSLEMKANLILGHTLRHEIERLRLNEATRLLANSELSLRDVAERCGFCSASYLVLRYKAAFGQNPSSFRT